MKLNLSAPILILILWSSIVLMLLIYLGNQKAWQDHLVVDFGFYYRVAYAFFKNHSFGIIPENAYFPGSLFFFLIPAISFLFTNYSWEDFIQSFIAVNIILIIIHLIIYYKKSITSAYIFLAILAFSGPLILYRHELFSSLILLISLIFLRNNKINSASFFLGFATSIKIFPVLILPYYFILALKNNQRSKIINILTFFIIGVLTTLSVYVLQGSPISEISKSLNFNTTKPVHIESLWASFLTLNGKLINGNWILGKSDQNGIYGIDPNYVTIPIDFFNYAWVLPIAVFYLYILKKSGPNEKVKPEISFLIILLFIIFSKIITPQYLFWFLPLFPLFTVGRNINLLSASLVVILLTVMLTQFIYPLHYTDLLFKFYTSGQDSQYFFILFFRNILLILLFFLVFRLTFKKTAS